MAYRSDSYLATSSTLSIIGGEREITGNISHTPHPSSDTYPPLLPLPYFLGCRFNDEGAKVHLLHKRVSLLQSPHSSAQTACVHLSVPVQILVCPPGGHDDIIKDGSWPRPPTCPAFVYLEQCMFDCQGNVCRVENNEGGVAS